MMSLSRPQTPPPLPRTSIVRELRPREEVPDAVLVAEVQRGAPGATTVLFDRYARHVERLVWSLLGPESESEDIMHEVFIRAFEGIHALEDATKLKGWLTGITVYTAREWIRRRTRRRWLRFMDEVPETPHVGASEEVNEATRATYAVLSEMNADDRVLFSLRYIEGLELSEVARACDVSLATVKRRLADVGKRFVNRAKHHEALRPWLEGGRWTTE
ncbi:MAG: RNA polymerase sigma factor [Labilithrix sp.]|nr:RNA polymerase sigma factor [Labilithrix sp.]